ASGGIEYDVLAQPGARLDDLRLVIEGADAVETRPDGSLAITTSLGRIEQRPPRVWQTNASGGRTPLACMIEVDDANTLRFCVPGWHGDRPLTIDPSLVYSTYVEGTASDEGWAIATDASGSAYVAGTSASIDFPVTPGSFDTVKSPSSEDSVVFKLTPSGAALDYATFLGGKSAAYAIKVNGEGNALVAGVAAGTDFPTTAGAYSTTLHGGGDCFVTEFDASGSNLVFSTYFGGSGGEPPYGLAVDSAGRIVIGGPSGSPDLPVTPNAPFPTKPAHGAVDTSGFIARFSPDGSALDYCTYFGGAIYE